MQIKKTNVAIIGGGLAGVLAALRLAKNHIDFILIDSSLPGSNGRLGGFAAFSGAKFSLPPAGLGLLPLVDGIESLNSKISEVLAVMELSFDSTTKSIDAPIRREDLSYLREYQSLLLTPPEIESLLERLTAKLPHKFEQGKCENLRPSNVGWKFEVLSSTTNQKYLIEANAVFYAGGRLGANFLSAAGAVPTRGKGLDVGIRIEAFNHIAYARLRSLGPDAKILKGSCRTFCLNVPGSIYYYPFNEILIPGGVVAASDVHTGNVGLLVRVQDKNSKLKSVLDASKKMDFKAVNETVITGLPHDHLEKYGTPVLGGDVVGELQSFCQMLSAESLIDWEIPYKIHMPLLDWYWDTYGLPGSHQSSLNNIYVIGDSAGHARGLLQAALGGWLAAEEYLDG